MSECGGRTGALRNQMLDALADSRGREDDGSGFRTKIVDVHRGDQGVDLGAEMKKAKYCLDPPGAGFR